MKIKLINSNTTLPNCWKSCGVDKDTWDKLHQYLYYKISKNEKNSS